MTPPTVGWPPGPPELPGGGERAGRQGPVNVWAAGVNVSSISARPWAPAPTVRFVLPQQDYPATCGGPMTVVAGIIALLLLGYLVVALLNPERF